MSISLMQTVWKSNLPTPTHKLVLLALADCANNKWLCWPSIARIAQASQISERQVQRIVADLKERGLIEVLEQAIRYKTPVYHVRGDKLTPLPLRGDTHVTPGATPTSPQG